MAIAQLAGTTLILAFLVSVVGTALSPPRLYALPDFSERLKLIQTYRGRWTASQVVSGVSFVVTAAGILLLAAHLRAAASAWLVNLAGGAYLLGVACGLVYVAQYTRDPLSAWSRPRPGPFLLGCTLLMLAAGALFGFALLQAGFAGWLAYLFIGYALIAGAAYLAFNLPAFYVLAIFSLIELALGIALLWRA
jgi:hypothetical protein